MAVAFNVSLNTSKTNNASVLALANVEALADGESMTDEECADKSGCVAIWDSHYCTGKNGVKYSYSDPA